MSLRAMLDLPCWLPPKPLGPPPPPSIPTSTCSCSSFILACLPALQGRRGSVQGCKPDASCGKLPCVAIKSDTSGGCSNSMYKLQQIQGRSSWDLQHLRKVLFADVVNALEQPTLDMTANVWSHIPCKPMLGLKERRLDVA